MFSIFGRKLSKDNSAPFKSLILFLTCLSFSACSSNLLKTQDPELLALETFAKHVTTHLFEMNPNSYIDFQKSLEKDIAPTVLAQLQKQGIYAGSESQIQKNIKAMEKSHKRCLIHVTSTGFPSKVTEQGLVPVEVQGTVVKSLNDLSKATDFDVIYLINNKTGTKNPIVAGIEIKKFD